MVCIIDILYISLPYILSARIDCFVHICYSDDLPHETSFAFENVAYHHHNQVQMDQMKSLGSDEEDAPPNILQQDKSKQTVTKKYFHDLDKVEDLNGNAENKESEEDDKQRKKKKKKKKKYRSKSNHNLANPKFKKFDSFDQFQLDHPENDSQNEREKSNSGGSKKYSKDDIVVSSGQEDDNNWNQKMNDKMMRKPSATRRVTSCDTIDKKKQIVVLDKSLKKRVVSPPPIKSKSEFQMLVRPVQSADAIALKKRVTK